MKPISIYDLYTIAMIDVYQPFGLFQTIGNIYRKVNFLYIIVFVEQRVIGTTRIQKDPTLYHR